MFCQKKINLLISGRNLSRLEKLKDELKDDQYPEVDVNAMPADLSSFEGRQKVVEAIRSNVPDLVINNAGFGLYGDCLNQPIDKLTAMLDVNGRAVLEITLEAAKAMISAGKKGVILNISSAAAFQIMPQMSVYSATKAFVNQFSQGLDFELKSLGVRVLTLCPGMVDTDFQRRAGAKDDWLKFGCMSASFVAGQVLDQINQLDSLRIIDWKSRMGTYFSFLLPKSLRASLLENCIKKRISKTL